MDFTLNQEQYEALVSLARCGTYVDGQVDSDKARQLEAFLKTIEKANGITRHLLWIRWQEAKSPNPPTTRFPETWPPSQQYLVELVGRPVAKVDVDAVLEQHANLPIGTMVTKDPGATLGWTLVDDFFLTG